MEPFPKIGGNGFIFLLKDIDSTSFFVSVHLE